MQIGPRILIMAVRLIILVATCLVAYFLVHNGVDTHINDKWWGIASVGVALLCLIVWVLYEDRDQFNK